MLKWIPHGFFWSWLIASRRCSEKRLWMHPSQNNMLPKVMIRLKKNPISQIFHPTKILMKIDKMADVFVNLILVPPRGYNLFPKALIKVSKVSWTSHLSYKTLWSSFQRKWRKDKLNFSQKTPSKSPHRLRLNKINGKKISVKQINVKQTNVIKLMLNKLMSNKLLPWR